MKQSLFGKHGHCGSTEPPGKQIHSPTFTKRRLYLRRCAARPFGFFFFSAGATFGVCDRTLPARAKEPWTLPASRWRQQKVGA